MASLKRAMAAIRLARTNRLFLSVSKCHTLCAITTIRWMRYIFLETNISKNIEWRTQIYYMEESVWLGTKPLVDSIRHFIRDPSGVFSVCHLCECRIVQWRHDSRLAFVELVSRVASPYNKKEHYALARRYEFYVLVARTISHANSICLGVVIDSKLSWQPQITAVCKTFGQKVKYLKRLRVLPKKVLEAIYFRSIVPSATYGILVWGTCSPALLHNVERIHLRASKIIYSLADVNLKTLKYIRWHLLMNVCKLKADLQSVLRTLESLFLFFCFVSCKISQNVTISQLLTWSKFKV